MVTAELEYRARCSAFTRDRSILLGEPGLRVREHGRPARLLPYHAVRRVYLSRTPSRFIPVLYRCRLEMADGSHLSFSNQNYLGMARFVDQGPAYAAFVRALHRRLRDYPVRFEQGLGRTAGYAIWALALMLGLFLGLLFLLGAIRSDLLSMFASLLGTLPLAGLVYLFHKRNRPAGYRPESIPRELLPAEGD